MAMYWGTACIQCSMLACLKRKNRELILYNLDINQICASGSACTSGADMGSHVIRAINNNPNQIAVRFSFSKHNTKEEVDSVVSKPTELI